MPDPGTIYWVRAQTHGTAGTSDWSPPTSRNGGLIERDHSER